MWKEKSHQEVRTTRTTAAGTVYHGKPHIQAASGQSLESTKPPTEVQWELTIARVQRFLKPRVLSTEGKLLQQLKFSAYSAIPGIVYTLAMATFTLPLHPCVRHLNPNPSRKLKLETWKPSEPLLARATDWMNCLSSAIKYLIPRYADPPPRRQTRRHSGQLAKPYEAQ